MPGRLSDSHGHFGHGLWQSKSLQKPPYRKCVDSKVEINMPVPEPSSMIWTVILPTRFRGDVVDWLAGHLAARSLTNYRDGLVNAIFCEGEQKKG